ncbi:MAG: flagellar motor switch protein FliG, partial [Alphaproteobacteria bacterium]|nr:flagellar motor switch protein FliG [Alphaproteobacteria bacterium]
MVAGGTANEQTSAGAKGRALTGAQKAATVMLALKEEHVVAPFTKMDEQVIKEVSLAMSLLGRMDSDVVDRVFDEFVSRLSSTGMLMGSYDGTQKILRESLGEERADRITEEMRGPAGRTVWDKLSNVNEVMLATYLKNEYPQTIAVILSKIDGGYAARVLAALPEETSIEVINRMLHLEGVSKEVLLSVEKTLRTEFMSNLQHVARQDLHELMAEIFNNFDR